MVGVQSRVCSLDLNRHVDTDVQLAQTKTHKAVIVRRIVCGRFTSNKESQVNLGKTAVTVVALTALACVPATADQQLGRRIEQAIDAADNGNYEGALEIVRRATQATDCPQPKRSNGFIASQLEGARQAISTGRDSLARGTLRRLAGCQPTQDDIERMSRLLQLTSTGLSENTLSRFPPSLRDQFTEAIDNGRFEQAARIIFGILTDDALESNEIR